MTDRVYIIGDVGDPRNLKLFDADTGKQLDDVAEVQFTISATKQPLVDLRRVNSTLNERCELVPRPPHAMAGREFYRVALDISRQAGASQELFLGGVDTYMMQPSGELELNPLGAWHSKRLVDDQQVAMARDPQGIRYQTAEDVLNEVAKGALVDPILRQAFPNTKPPASANPFVNPAQCQHVFGKKSTCDECKGTGYVVLFNGRSPCSRGCKPQE